MPETFDLDDDLEGLESPSEAIAHSGSGKNLRTIIILVIVGIVVVGVGYSVFRMMNPSHKMSINQEADTQDMMTDRELAMKQEQEALHKKVKYEKLYSQLSPEQSADVVRELSYSGILFETEQKGKYVDIFVDRDRLPEARKALALQGLPAGGIVGYEIFDNASNMGVTDFDKRVRFIRAISGELEKAIIQIDSIEGAKVQVVLPEQRLFSVSQPPVTAAILVRRRPFVKRINDETVYGIIKLVSNAVENLQPENVTVVDTDGQVLSEGVFERMRKKVGAKTAKISDIDARYHGNISESLSESISATQSDELGNPSSGNAETSVASGKVNLQDFLAYKKSYESDLTQKASDQMAQIMGKNSYKLSVTTEMTPPKTDADVPNIKQVSVSIVLNQLMPDANLTPEKKKALFATVGSAVGYVKGRDRIVLSKSDFVVPAEPEVSHPSSSETALDAQSVSATETSVSAQSTTGDVQDPVSQTSSPWMGRVKWVGLGLLGIAGIGLLGYGALKLGKGGVGLVKRLWRWLNSSTDSELRDELEINHDMAVDLEEDIANVRRLASENPDKLAQLMEAWLQDSEVPIR